MGARKVFWYSIFIEVLGSCFCAAGIGIELAYNADIGYQLISMGSLFIAVGSIMFSKVGKILRR